MRIERWGVCLLLFSLTSWSCNGTHSGGQQNANRAAYKNAKWVAQYRSPSSAGITGTQLSTFFYSAVCVVSPTIVFACGDMPDLKSGNRIGMIAHTTDGGQSWTETRSDLTGMRVPTLNSIYFVSPEIGYIVGADTAGTGVMMKTTDGGGSWTGSRLAAKQTPTAVFFIDADNGWIGASTPPPGDDEGLGGPSAIMATTDGGHTWEPRINLSVSIFDIVFTDKQNGWAGGSKGTIYHTSDGGLTWNSQRSELEMGDGPVNLTGEGIKGFNMQGVQFIDPTHGFAAASAEEEDTGRLLATDNGGESWRRTWIVADSGVRDVHFVNSEEGWALTEKGAYIYHTVDGGRTWLAEPKAFEQDTTLVRLGAADASHVWAVGGAAIFYRVSE
jgi:photosystem II stability/assembly factor-like uncharacterized protein